MDTEAPAFPDWLVKMPKTDLHCHMGGSMRIGTVLELGDKYGVRLPASTPEELGKHIVYKNRPNKCLSSYLDCIKICESVLVRPEAFRRAAYELCEDFHNENGTLFEVRFGPTNYERPGLQLYEIMEATLDGIKAAAKDFNMHTGLIICGIRTDPDATRKAVDLAVHYQDRGVVGFDLAGKEKGHGPKDFEEIFLPILKNFIPVTIHAGEEDGVKSIADAVIYLNAQRIGHGVSLRQSPRLYQYMNKTRTGIESCLSSNADTGAVTSLGTHGFRTYFFDRLRISPHTDNRTISSTTSTKENALLMHHLGLKQTHIYAAARHAIKSSFVDLETQERFLIQLYDFMLEHLPPEEEHEEFRCYFPYMDRVVNLRQATFKNTA